MNLHIDVMKYAFGLQMQGLKWTVLIGVAGLSLALVLGFIIGFGLASKNRFCNMLCEIYVRIFRNTPFMIQVYIGYYVLPFTGLCFSSLAIGIVCLMLYMASYMGVVVQSGIQAIPKGQYEAAEVLRIPRFKIVFRIILPQIMTIILPPMTNLLMTGLKETSVLSIISVGELMMKTKEAVSSTYISMEIYIMAALIYWGLNILISRGSKKMERRLSFFK